MARATCRPVLGAMIAALAVVVQCSSSMDSGSDVTLLEAAEAGDLARLTMLVRAGEDVNVANLEGVTPLHYAALVGNETMVQLLLDEGAEAKAVTDKQETALHWAATQGNIEVIRMLYRAGTDINAKNREGQTALDIAEGQDGNYSAVIKALQAAGGERGEDLEDEPGVEVFAPSPAQRNLD